MTSLVKTFGDIKHAIYINLDSRTDRRKSFEKHFNELHTSFPNDYTFIPVQRFSAIRNEDIGAIGCSQSHAECIRIAKANCWDYVIIFEDDAIVLHPDILVHNVNEFLKRFNDDWDVIILSGNNFRPFHVDSPEFIRVANCQCCTSYIVQRHYYDTLIRNFDDGAKKYAASPADEHKYACDQYWKKLQMVDRWYLITPMCIIQKADYSDNCKAYTNYSSHMIEIDKSFHGIFPIPE